MCVSFSPGSFVAQQNETPGSKEANQKGKRGENIAGYGAEMVNMQYIFQ